VTWVFGPFIRSMAGTSGFGVGQRSFDAVTVMRQASHGRTEVGLVGRGAGVVPH
jgi:hypothetical protein